MGPFLLKNLKSVKEGTAGASRVPLLLDKAESHGRWSLTSTIPDMSLRDTSSMQCGQAGSPNDGHALDFRRSKNACVLPGMIVSWGGSWGPQLGEDNIFQKVFRLTTFLSQQPLVAGLCNLLHLPFLNMWMSTVEPEQECPQPQMCMPPTLSILPEHRAGGPLQQQRTFYFFIT